MSGQDDARSHLDLCLLIVDLLHKNPCPAVTDIVSSFDSVAVHFDPADGPEVLKHLTQLNPPTSNPENYPNAKEVTIPICYDGDTDLDDVAKSTGLTKAEIIELHSNAEFTVAAIGFSPGFPYLTGLPKELHLPRKTSPHPVPAGAVAIAGDQAGVYPNASQGGWHVLGKTSQQLFDPKREKPSLLQAGDQVKFEITESTKSPAPPKPATTKATKDLEIIEAGALTNVQDLGRKGYQHMGVSPGGAADPISARVANRLVGNPDDAAVLECTMTGPVLKFHKNTHVAWVGWADARNGRPHKVAAGETIDLTSRMLHLRGYIAVAGGVDVPKLMSSRATDIRAQFGGHQGRPLEAGDTLPIGDSATDSIPDDLHISWPHTQNGILELRYLKGIQTRWFSDEMKQKFSQSIYNISPVSDRTGTRLIGTKVSLIEPREMVSQPAVAGSIQIPPNGQPIVLMAEHQTIGGYPQIGHVISADMPKLARAWPGQAVHFKPATIFEARQAWKDLQRELSIVNAGIQMQSHGK